MVRNLSKVLLDELVQRRWGAFRHYVVQHDELRPGVQRGHDFALDRWGIG